MRCFSESFFGVYVWVVWRTVLDSSNRDALLRRERVGAGDTAMRLNEGIRVQEQTPCLLCGQSGLSLYKDIRDPLFGVPGNWETMKCERCDLVWLSPWPIPEDIEKLYLGYASHVPPDASPGRFARFWKTVKRSVMTTALGYRANDVNKTLGWLLCRVGLFREVGAGTGYWLQASQRGRLLDVGCGAGGFIAQMASLGWEVVGIEPDPDAVAVARQNRGLEIHLGTLHSVDLPKATFDAVTLNNVIEHVQDPAGLLRACGKLLRPTTGRLIVVTPNVESLGHRWFGRSWIHLDPPRHLILFSPATLRTVANQAGLHVEGLRTSSRAAGGAWYMSRLLKRYRKLPGLTMSPQNPSILLLLEGAVFWIIEHLMINLRPCGEELVMVLSKQEQE
jgi:2-polyprenyl-3-methyl-5-hydroxy-6-metoxy-1,4-benzoquinol methylase